MFVLATNVTILESLGYSVLGIAIVFAALVLLMGIIKLQSIILNKKTEKPAAPAAAPAAPAAPAAAPQLAPGSAGEVKLYDVPDKVAAQLMAIVADTVKKPLNELRFISIKEVK
ncbi:MAG: hypothetical protein E7458_02285 [Ruminococcaceae bacterium]|nr:hypothetical protein [Oscillospiraceae bacterium]